MKSPKFPGWLYHFATDLLQYHFALCWHCFGGNVYNIPQPENNGSKKRKKNHVPWVQLSAETTPGIKAGSYFPNYQLSSKQFSCCAKSSFPPHLTTTLLVDVTALALHYLKGRWCNEHCWDNGKNKSQVPTSHLISIQIPAGSKFDTWEIKS